MKMLVLVFLSFLIPPQEDLLPRALDGFTLGEEFTSADESQVYQYGIDVPIYKIYQLSGAVEKVGINNRGEIVYLQKRVTRDAAASAKAFKESYLPRYEDFIFSRDEGDQNYSYSFFDGNTLTKVFLYYEIFQVELFDVWGRAPSSAPKNLPTELVGFTLGGSFTPPPGAEKEDWDETITYRFPGERGDVVLSTKPDGAIISVSLWVDGDMPAEFDAFPRLYNHFIYYKEIVKVGYSYHFFDGNMFMKLSTDTEMSNIDISEAPR